MCAGRTAVLQQGVTLSRPCDHVPDSSRTTINLRNLTLRGPCDHVRNSRRHTKILYAQHKHANKYITDQTHCLTCGASLTMTLSGPCDHVPNSSRHLTGPKGKATRPRKLHDTCRRGMKGVDKS